jgi:uncharacterized membrane protein YebE (DUF533 family)
MSLGAIIGQMLQQGMAQQTHGRLRNFGDQAAGMGGMEQILGALMGGGGQQGAPARGGAANAGGDLGALLGGLMGGGQPGAARGGAGANPMGDLLGSLMGGGAAQGGAAGANPLGGLLGAMLGGGGAGGAAGNPLAGMLGAMLGGGKGGSAALGGGAMAVLGTLAMTALKAYAEQSGKPEAAPAPANAPALMGSDAEALILRAMIAAASADGKLEQAELDRIVSKVDDGGVSPQEKAFIEAELARPADPAALAADAATPEQAAQVYAASILAIDIDSEAERAYLRALAQALALPAGAVRQLHQMTGAPMA